MRASPASSLVDRKGHLPFLKARSNLENNVNVKVKEARAKKWAGRL